MDWLGSRSADAFRLLSEQLKAPVYVFRKDVLVKTFGKVPFFQEVLDRRNFSVSVGGNSVKSCTFANSKIDDYVFLLGPFKSGLGPSDEELVEHFERLPVFHPGFQGMLDFAVKSISVSAKLELDNSVQLKRQKLVLDFLHHLGNSKDVSLLLRKAAEFFVQAFRLNNAFLSALEGSYRFFGERPVYADVESVVLGLLKDSRSIVRIDDVRTDFMLKGVKGRERLPRRILAYPLLHDRALLGSVILYSDDAVDFEPDLINELVHVLLTAGDFERVRTSARIDSLTGLYNRNFFVPAVHAMIEDSRQREAPISLLLYDVDDFKKFNDTFGHPKGDSILKSLGHIALGLAPKDALCCRYGGEEFIIAMHADQNVARDFAEQLRARVEADCDLTISIGLITCLNSSANFSDLINEADRALYRAKDLGKNRVVPFVMVDRNLGVIDTLNV